VLTAPARVSVTGEDLPDLPASVPDEHAVSGRLVPVVIIVVAVGLAGTKIASIVSLGMDQWRTRKIRPTAG